jgi:predicted dehydrogenase
LSNGGAKRAVIHDDTTAEEGVITKTLWEGEDRVVKNTLLLQDFARAVREGRQPETGLEKALIVQQISDAIYASAEKGAAVEII